MHSMHAEEITYQRERERESADQCMRREQSFLERNLSPLFWHWSLQVR